MILAEGSGGSGAGMSTYIHTDKAAIIGPTAKDRIGGEPNGRREPLIFLAKYLANWMTD